MGLRKPHYTPPIDNKLHILNQELEDLGQGVDNGRVRDNAAIQARKIRHADLGLVTVDTTEKAFRHGFGIKPLFIGVTMASEGQVWVVPSKTDATRFFLQADANGRQALVVAFG
jgi:hypothetical protein